MEKLSNGLKNVIDWAARNKRILAFFVSLVYSFFFFMHGSNPEYDLIREVLAALAAGLAAGGYLRDDMTESILQKRKQNGLPERRNGNGNGDHAT